MSISEKTHIIILHIECGLKLAALIILSYAIESQENADACSK